MYPWLLYAVVPILATESKGLALAHPTRARIYAHLVLLPGDHFRSIVRTLGLAVGDVHHHLAVLLREGVVKEVKDGGRRRYYVHADGLAAERNELFAKHWNYRDVRLRVLLAVRHHGAGTPATVGEALGISRQLAAYHLARLVDLGLVTRDNGHYRCTR